MRAIPENVGRFLGCSFAALLILFQPEKGYASFQNAPFRESCGFFRVLLQTSLHLVRGLRVGELGGWRVGARGERRCGVWVISHHASRQLGHVAPPKSGHPLRTPFYSGGNFRRRPLCGGALCPNVVSRVDSHHAAPGDAPSRPRSRSRGGDG